MHCFQPQVFEIIIIKKADLSVKRLCLSYGHLMNKSADRMDSMMTVVNNIVLNTGNLPKE